ncbi:MAG: FAD-binding protein, partial [Raoultibacter sp.]
DLPVIVTADTVDDVASQAGISSEGLKATIESFNADAPTGTDSVFNRPIAAAIGEGPYYIIKMNLRYAHSYGGLIANENLEVLDWAEKPIAGLYGAGQMLCSIQGRNNIAKPSTGTSFAYTSGRRAVLNALEAV